MIERIEIHVTALSTRLKRIFASGTYDTGPDESITSKPVLVKVHADGVVGYHDIARLLAGACAEHAIGAGGALATFSAGRANCLAGLAVHTDRNPENPHTV